MLGAAIARLNDRFTRFLVEDDDALLVLFRMLNDAEEKGEACLFHEVAERVPARIATLVRRHEADERRHRELTREALALLHDRPGLVDRRADLVAVADGEVGELLTFGGQTDAELGRAYLFLHALERRMCAQLLQIGGALRARRPALADIVDQMRADELRHVTWCEVIAFELLGRDEATHAAVRGEMIALEARVFARVTAQNLSALLTVGLSAMPVAERAFWTAVSWALRVVPALPVPDRNGDLAAHRWKGASREGRPSNAAAASQSPKRQPTPPQAA